MEILYQGGVSRLSDLSEQPNRSHELPIVLLCTHRACIYSNMLMHFNELSEL